VPQDRENYRTPIVLDVLPSYYSAVNFALLRSISLLLVLLQKIRETTAFSFSSYFNARMVTMNCYVDQ